jgi:hypothetical protein
MLRLLFLRRGYNHLVSPILRKKYSTSILMQYIFTNFSFLTSFLLT